MRKKTWLVISVTIAAVCLFSAAVEAAIDAKAAQWTPVDIPIDNPGYSGNAFDLVAAAEFVHAGSGEKRGTLLFYAGGNTWKIRFTGTRPGAWTFTTSSADSDLNGIKGKVTVSPAPAGSYGFIVHKGNRWARQKGPEGTLEALVPQFVMYSNPSGYHGNPAKIDADIKTFMVRHGFNGFHTNVFCRWFGIDKVSSDQLSADPNPDFRTFEALELLIKKVHAAGGVVHIWTWGDESRKMTPERWGINGPVDRRLQRYIAARLGPLPGWTMGYGFDLFEWVNTSQLCAWGSYMKDRLGWPHYLGGRSMTNELNQICETLDYSSYEQHRPDYAKYVETIEARPTKPSFSEDRFRLRDPSPYPKKDYTEELTRRGLYHSTMAGGVANIWGNLVGSDGEMSMPYPNPQWSRTYADFFKDRFTLGMVRDNAITDGVCLRTPERARYVFYKEDTGSISMDLSKMPSALSGLAVDTKKPHKPISLGTLSPGKHTWKAPYSGDWVIAVEKSTAA